MASGDVRLAGSSAGASCAERESSAVGYIAFSSESGSIAKMAVVRRRVPRVVGRYLIGEPLAAGGMATVHLGRLGGAGGFSRTVAVKRLHAQFAANPDFVERFVDEARIASRVHHANVVQTIDVVAAADEVLLVLELVHGESLARLRRLAIAADQPIPPAVASAITIGVLRGLHAAHEARSAKGAPLGIVHRDVSPQNVLVGVDGVPRVLDFGIAKASDRVQETRTSGIKGKLAYMAPEQISGEPLDRRTDLFAAGVVLWEILAGERLFRGEDAMSTMEAIFEREPAKLAGRVEGVTFAVDAVLARALMKEPSARWASADEMARALEAALPPASDREVAEWVDRVAHDVLEERARVLAAFEREDDGRGGGSETRVAAAPPPSGAASRRDAVAPPPLEITEDTATPDGVTLLTPPRPAAATDTMTPDGVTALTPPRPAAATIPTLDEVAEDAPTMLRVAPDEPVEAKYVLPTPLVMVAPVADDAPSMETRIAPIEHLRARVRAPIPMPTPLPPKPSAVRLALYLVGPAAVAAAVLLAVGARGASTASAAPHAAAAPPPRAVEPLPVPPPAVVVAASTPGPSPQAGSERAEPAPSSVAKPEADAKRPEPKASRSSPPSHAGRAHHGARRAPRPRHAPRPIPFPKDR